MNQEEFRTAIAVLDKVRKAHLRMYQMRTDMLKDGFRRDGLTLDRAAAILEDCLANGAKVFPDFQVMVA